VRYERRADIHEAFLSLGCPWDVPGMRPRLLASGSWLVSPQHRETVVYERSLPRPRRFVMVR